MQEEWLSLEKRYEELEQLVADPEVISDQSKYSRLARELSKLSKVVPTIRQLKKAEQEAEGLEVML
ncbi:MAG: PCRF domain-containing protein, partial [Candidatus Omnitrophica bacterium]|nr:PCRF domain-containing protein [Candidatus Omnitrophota bacterium]